MTYTVLARKYRPQTFSDLVGQEHVTRTLGNAITSGRVAHAFLFTGVRGVGKTTTARILAKALNCVNGPTPEPCGVCDPCREITAGMDLDVLEIDGASNNSVEDVRRLQETIPFRPARDRYKIVIVDEVHMLSTGAFNAFLKTLEEPPPHVKFVFATTESHKVPITIRSRCQRYDFRLIPQTVVAARVREILARESIGADEQAVSIVAREAAGSMRDALTLLDQIVAFAGTELRGQEVAQVLGIADRELLHRAASAVLEGDGKEALAVVDALASRGLDVLHFAKALTELMRDLVVLRTCEDGAGGPATDLVALVEEERRRASALASRIEPLELQRAFASLSLLIDEIAKASMPKLVLEMGLVRLATRPPLRALAEVIARLEALEAGGGGTPRPRSSGGSGGGSDRGGGGRSPRASASPPDDARALIDKLRGSEQSVPPAPALSRVPEPVASPAPTVELRPEPAAKVAPLPSAPPPRAEPTSQPAPPAFQPIPPLQSSPPAAPKSVAIREVPAGGSIPANDAPHPADDASPARDGFEAQWENVVAILMETRPALGAVLHHATPSRAGSEELVIAFVPGSFYARQADAPEAKAALAEIAARFLGFRPTIRVTERSAGQSGSTIAELEAERQRTRLEATKKKAINHPMVIEALSVFDARAESVEVRLEGDG